MNTKRIIIGKQWYINFDKNVMHVMTTCAPEGRGRVIAMQLVCCWRRLFLNEINCFEKMKFEPKYQKYFKLGDS